MIDEEKGAGIQFSQREMGYESLDGHKSPSRVRKGPHRKTLIVLSTEMGNSDFHWPRYRYFFHLVTVLTRPPAAICVAIVVLERNKGSSEGGATPWENDVRLPTHIKAFVRSYHILHVIFCLAVVRPDHPP